MAKMYGFIVTVRDFPLPSFRRADDHAYAQFRDDCQEALEIEYPNIEATVVTMRLPDPLMFDVRFDERATLGGLTPEEQAQGQALTQGYGERILQILQDVANERSTAAPRIITDISGVQ